MRSMTDDKVKRRLTTVLCADVHGYSRLMGADEAGTLGTLRRYRSAIAALVERHDGRIVNTWGDALREGVRLGSGYGVGVLHYGQAVFSPVDKTQVPHGSLQRCGYWISALT